MAYHMPRRVVLAAACLLLHTCLLPADGSELSAPVLLNGGTSSSRQLLAVQAERVAPCFWTPQGCRPDALVWFSPATPPSSIYHKMLMMSVERNGWCGALKDRAACMSDQNRRCFWIENLDTKCQNADTYEVDQFINGNFKPTIENIPAAITCPGSLARQFFTCYSHPAPGLCAQLPGCAAMKVEGFSFNRCFPKWFTSANTIQQVAHRQSIAALDSRFFGSCESTCWLQQAAKCVAQTTSTDCTKLSFCRYISESKTCFRKIWATDQSVADDTVNRLYQACYGMKDQKSCEGRPPVLMQQLGTYKFWTPDQGGGQCSLTR